MGDAINQFIAITDVSPDKARQYLNISDNNIERAVELFFETGGVDLIEATQPQTSTSTTNEPPPVSPPQARPGRSGDDIIDLDSDEELNDLTEGQGSASAGAANAFVPPTHESDEAMARRLQEEMYGQAGVGDVDADGYRAPIARTTETLVGPDPYDLNDEDEMRAAVLEQLQRREVLRQSKTSCFSRGF